MEFTKTQIAALVLGYLKGENLYTVSEAFTESCPHFAENMQNIKMGKYFVTRVLGMRLVDFLEEYAVIYSIVQGRLEETNFYETHARSTLVEQILYLLDKDIATAASSTPVRSQNSEVDATPAHALPGNDSCEENESSSPRTPKRNVSRNKSRDRELLDVSEVLTQTLLESHELHEKIAETINIVRNTPEMAKPVSDEHISAGASKELDAIIKTVVQRTEEDPVYNNLIDEIIGATPLETQPTRKPASCNTAVSTPSCSSSEGVKFGTDVTNIENQSTNVPDSMDDHTDAAVRSIIEASQNSFPEPQDPVSFPEPPNVLHIPESQNLEQKVDNIFVYDGTLDSYLKSSGGTNVNSNPVYINPGGVIVVPPETTPKQFYIVNNQQLVNMGVPAMNGVISDNDILAMPTIIVNEELDPNFVSQMRSTNSRPSEGVKKEKKIAPKLSNIHEFLTFNNPPQSTKRNIVKKTKKDKSLPFADRAVVAAPQATPSIVTAPSISEPIPPIITIPVSIANKTTPSIVTIATSVTASSVVTVSACSEASASTTSVVTVSASPRTTPSVVTVPVSRTTPSVATVPGSRTTPSVLTVPASRTTPSVTTASLTRQASHVRNLDFSTPSTKEEEHKPDEDDRAWDKDLRVLVQDCENKYPTPKRKRPVSSRTRKKSKCKGEEVKAEDAKEKEVETKAEKKKKVKTEKEKKEKKVKTEKEKKKTKVKNKEKKGKEVKVEEEGEKEVRIEDEEGKEVRIEDEEGKEVRIEEEEEQEVRTEEEAEKMMKTGEDKEKEALRTPVKDMLPKTPGGDMTTSSSCHCTPFTDVLEEHLKGVDLTSMPTPQIPITPGFALTPGEMMGCNQRLTDYSTSSSYYQPSDSEQNKSLDQLIEEYRTLDNKSPTPADKSPKLKILSDVVIEEGKVPNSETKKSEKRNCREHLKRFNRNIIGKKNLSLVNCQETPWSSESDSENESELSVEQNNQTVVLKNDSSEQKTGSVKKLVDQEVDVVKKSEIKDDLGKKLHSAKKSRNGKDNDSRKKTDGRTVVGNNESLKKSKPEEELGGVEKSEVEKDSSVNVDSEKERDATNAISSIISTVEIKNTLDEDAKNKKSLLARLEVVRQRTIKKIKEPVEKPPRRQSTYKKSPKVTKKKQTKKKEVKPEENTDEEAQKLVKGLAQRGIHLVPNKSPYKAKEVEKPPLPVESVESYCTFDRRTYEDFEVATHEEKTKRKSMKNYDCNLLNKSMSAQVYIEELEEEVTRIIKWTPFQPLADFRPKVVTSATKKSKKCQETDDDLIMDMVVSGSLNEKSPETRGRKRKAKCSEDESKQTDKKTKTSASNMKLLKKIDVDEFLDKVHS